ncbi:hypothetical protein D046_8056, partial [Vibrio parahaemolyticus V-223/04]
MHKLDKLLLIIFKATEYSVAFYFYFLLLMFTFKKRFFVGYTHYQYITT